MDTTLTSSENADNGALVFSEQIICYLNEMRRWAKFLSIMGFIGIGLIVLLALSIGSVLNFISSLSPTPLPFPSFLLTLIYLVVALLCFFPVYHLYLFSTKMETALMKKDQSELTGSFKNLKSVFRFVGVMTIVVFSINILAIVGVIMALLMVNQ